MLPRSDIPQPWQPAPRFGFGAKGLPVGYERVRISRYPVPVGRTFTNRPARLLVVTLPLGRFSGRSAPFLVPERVPHEGVPDHLDEPLRRWIYAALQGGGAELVALSLEIRIDYDRAGGNAALFLAQDPQPYELLAIVNAVLANGGPWPQSLPTDRRGTDSNAAGKAQLREDLITMLAAGSSVWQVSSQCHGLQHDRRS